MAIKPFLFPCLLLVLLASCQSEDGPITTTDPIATATKSYPDVSRELWVYFQRFEEEAKQRGVQVDLVGMGITGVVAEIGEEHVLGQCNFNPNRPNHVTIDKTFWNAASDRFREFVVFHELGHCSLFRDHREVALPTGACASLMRSGTGDCRDNYSMATRTFYLDELYNKAYYGDIFK